MRRHAFDQCVNAVDPNTKRQQPQSVMPERAVMQSRQQDKLSGKQKAANNSGRNGLKTLIYLVAISLTAALATAARGRSYNFLRLAQQQQEFIESRQKTQSETLCEIARKYAVAPQMQKALAAPPMQNAELYIYASRRQQTENFLYHCLPQLPLQNLNFEDIPIEPYRTSYTFNFLLLPDHWSMAAGLAKLRQMLNAKQRHKHQHLYVFVWQQRQLDELFQFLWRSVGILHAVGLNGTQMRQLYTYEPFTPQGFRVLSCENLPELFYDKLKNLQRAPLRISMFEDHLRAHPRRNFRRNGYYAVDGYIASNVVERLNATAKYMLPTDKRIYGSCFSNGSCTGVIGDVVAQRSDVAFNTRHTLRIELNYVEQLYPFYSRKLALVVPAGALQPDSLIFKRAFTDDLWRLLLFNFFMACLGFYVLQRLALYLIGAAAAQQRLKIWPIFELIFKLQFGEPLHNFTNVSSLRLFIVSWILCCYVITSVYFANMESSFVHKTYEPDINKLDDFQRHMNDTPIYIASDLFEVMNSTVPGENSTFPEKFRWILERATNVERNISGCPYGLEILQKNTSKAAFVYRREITRDFLARTYNNVDNHPNFHAVKQYIFSMPRSYIVPLGSPFRQKFDEFVGHLFEHGILEHWLTEFVVNHKHSSGTQQKYYLALGANSDGAGLAGPLYANLKVRVPLNIEILQGAFYLWCFGVSLSLLVFCYEHFCQFCANLRQRNFLLNKLK